MTGIVRDDEDSGGKRKKFGNDDEKRSEKKLKSKYGIRSLRRGKVVGVVGFLRLLGIEEGHDGDQEVKVMWDTIAGGDSEDDQYGIRMMDDDNFIDGSGVDPADLYEINNEPRTPGDAPQNQESIQRSSKRNIEKGFGISMSQPSHAGSPLPGSSSHGSSQPAS